MKGGFAPSVGYKIFKKIKKGYITIEEVEKIMKDIKKGKTSKFFPEEIKISYDGYVDPDDYDTGTVTITKIIIETPKGIVKISPYCYSSIEFSPKFS